MCEVLSKEVKKVLRDARPYMSDIKKGNCNWLIKYTFKSGDFIREFRYDVELHIDNKNFSVRKEDIDYCKLDVENNYIYIIANVTNTYRIKLN